MKRIVRWILIAVLIANLVAAATIWALNSKYKNFESDVFVNFGHGSSTANMARTLVQAGVIRYAWEFTLARGLNPSAKLQAGEYKFSEPASVLDVFRRIRRGDVYFFEFTVPEGSNRFDIAHLAEATGIMSSGDFLAVSADASPIHDLAPKALSLEGFLFPSTYKLSHSTTATDLCRMMTTEFRHQWKKLIPGDADVLHVATLASLVEKETGVPDERSLVAGVFANRLVKGMTLGCDPTVIYAALLENRYRGVIHRSDLDNPNPYNTYQHTGLPPGPIANPGAASLAAALHPAQTDYLYFVAKTAGGGHIFSSTLAAHEKAVAAYRQSQNPNAGKQDPKATAKKPGRKAG